MTKRKLWYNEGYCLRLANENELFWLNTKTRRKTI